MKRQALTRRLSFFLLFAVTLASADFKTTTARTFNAATAPAVNALAQPGNIAVNGFFNVHMARRGSSFQAAIVMEIPDNLHVNANRPLGKYAVPTTVKISAPGGFKITPVNYPRGTVRSFKFNEGSPADRLAVYETRAIFRFNVTVPPDFPQGIEHIRVRVNFQSCSDTVCYPPTTRNLDLAIGIIGPNDPVERINGRYFGSGGRGKRG